MSGVDCILPFNAKSVFCAHKTAFCIIASEMDIALRVTIHIFASGIYGVDFNVLLNNSSARPSNDIKVAGFIAKKWR